MAVTLVQSKTYASTSSNSFHFITLDTAPTTGNLLVLSIVSDQILNGGVPPSEAASSTTYSLATSAVDFTGSYLYYAVVTSGWSAETDVTLNASDSCCIHLFEYSGLLTASVLDKTASAVGQGSGSTVSTGTTATTTTADELLIALAGITGGGVTLRNVSSWNNSFTTIGNSVSTGSTTNIRCVTASRVVAATSTYTTTATLDGASFGDSGIIATFKAQAAVAGVPTRQAGRFVGYPSLLAQ